MNRDLIIAYGFMLVLIAGCASNPVVEHIPLRVNNNPNSLAVFFDGTANNEGSHTNIAKLHNLITLQNNANISAAYIEGVGTNGNFLGMAMGKGIGRDVREAYLYLGENYNPNKKDKIYIFGFSRGSYAARILAALIHVAGIPDFSHIARRSERKEYVEEIYDAYKTKKTIEQRREDVIAVTGKKHEPVEIEFMGIWDTVEALGFPDLSENIDVPNGNYADQLCNIKKAAHAVSIDDDRARIFTPILLTRDHLVTKCKKEVEMDDVVNEVWFSGAHADVGGGYNDTYIDGVSLNWMLTQIEPYNLVPKGSQVYANPFGVTHDPEKGVFRLIYHKLNRNLLAYANSSSYNKGKLKIHKSVIDRLAAIPVKSYEYRWLENYTDCFKPTKEGLTYLYEKECFDVVP